jgi:hypothetical protein
MENKINIAEILRDMPKGTKLYSPLFGKCECIEVVNSKYPIVIKAQSANGAVTEDFSGNGRFIDGLEDAECLLFPSAKMRCWDKFFKRGDIVYNPHSQMYAVFECWANDDYTEFNTTTNYHKDHTFGEEEVCDTECFVKANDEQKTLFIAAAEKHCGGKYNPETLQVEPVKVIEPKRSLKPFDKVLVRDAKDEVWKADYFSNYEKGNKTYPYNCVGDFYKSCIPYEGNEHLLGTDRSPK